jgi:hypothetical protein
MSFLKLEKTLKFTVYFNMMRPAPQVQDPTRVWGMIVHLNGSVPNFYRWWAKFVSKNRSIRLVKLPLRDHSQNRRTYHFNWKQKDELFVTLAINRIKSATCDFFLCLNPYTLLCLVNHAKFRQKRSINIRFTEMKRAFSHKSIEMSYGCHGNCFWSRLLRNSQKLWSFSENSVFFTPDV